MNDFQRRVVDEKANLDEKLAELRALFWAEISEDVGLQSSGSQLVRRGVLRRWLTT